MDLELGGKFKLGKKLGAGAFGEAYIAKNNTSGEEITVKIKDNRTQQHIVRQCAIEYSIVLNFILFSISIN